MKYLLLVLFSSTLVSLAAQDTVTNSDKKAKQYNLIKLGTSIQAILIPGYHDVDPYYGYSDYRNADYYYEGFNYQLYLGYEHIWEYKNNTAIALEPIAGASFHENSTNFFIGNNAKFYWVNKDIFRMGVAIYTGYSYAKHQTSRAIRKGDGSYYERIELAMHYQMLSTNISIIPFQFRLRSIPLVIEAQFAMFGVNVLWEKSESFYYSDGSEQRIRNATAFPSFLKTELKIGFVIP